MQQHPGTADEPLASQTSCPVHSSTQHLHRCIRQTRLVSLCTPPAVTSHSQPTPKAFNFKLSPANADVLQQLRLGFVATANNHVLDYGQPGLKETNEVKWRCFAVVGDRGTTSGPGSKLHLDQRQKT